MEHLLLDSFDRALASAADEPGAVEATLAADGFDCILRPEDSGGAGLPLSALLPLVIRCGAALKGLGFARMALDRLASVRGGEGLSGLVADAAIGAGLTAGGLERMVMLTVAHVTARTQFGRRLADFQVVQQQLAIMLEELAVARLGAEIGFGGRAFSMARTAAARVETARAANRIIANAHQLHGAIGMTADYPLARWTRAVRGWQQTHGTAAYWSRILARHRLADAEADCATFVRRALDDGGVLEG